MTVTEKKGLCQRFSIDNWETVIRDVSVVRSREFTTSVWRTVPSRQELSQDSRLSQLWGCGLLIYDIAWSDTWIATLLRYMCLHLQGAPVSFWFEDADSFKYVACLHGSLKMETRVRRNMRSITTKSDLCDFLLIASSQVCLNFWAHSESYRMKINSSGVKETGRGSWLPVCV